MRSFVLMSTFLRKGQVPRLLLLCYSICENHFQTGLWCSGPGWLQRRTHSKSPSSRPRGPFLLILQSYFYLWTFQKLFSSHFFSEKENINKKLHVHGNRSVVVVSHAWLIFRKRWYSKKPSNLSISGAWVLTMLVYKDLWMLLFFFGFSKSVLNLWRSNGNQDLVELFSSSTQR